MTSKIDNINLIESENKNIEILCNVLNETKLLENNGLVNNVPLELKNIPKCQSACLSPPPPPAPSTTPPSFTPPDSPESKSLIHYRIEELSENRIRKESDSLISDLSLASVSPDAQLPFEEYDKCSSEEITLINKTASSCQNDHGILGSLIEQDETEEIVNNLPADYVENIEKLNENAIEEFGTISTINSYKNSSIYLAQSKSVSVNSFESDGNIPIKLYDNIIELLKCPGCALPMRSPLLCEIGHSCCQKCVTLMKTCPLCKGPFSNMRSCTLEAILSKAQFQCFNSLAGCKVRFPLDLIDWHEKLCQYKTIKCFMGRVWGDCDWQGKDLSWKDHLNYKHADKIFNVDDCQEVELTWDSKTRSLPFASYYVFNWFKETFNLYQIVDQQNERCLWTMACCSPLSILRQKNFMYAYEIEIFSFNDEAKVLCQRFPCHNEQDKDILQEGTCVSIPMIELSRFMDENAKEINYRVRLIKIMKSTKSLTFHCDRDLPNNFQQTAIEGGNLKRVPAEAIVTRKTQELDVNKHVIRRLDEIGRRDSYSSHSDDDSELQGFVNDLLKKKWKQRSLTSPNLNRTFWEDSYNYNDSITSLRNLRETQEFLDDNQSLRTQINKMNESPNRSGSNSNDMSIQTLSKKKGTSIKRFRKSFRKLSQDFTELKYFGSKKTLAENDK